MRPIFEKFVPEEYRDIILRLENWTQQQNILEKATQSFRQYLQDCETRQHDGYERLQGRNLEQIELQFESHSLMFAHGGLCVPHVMSQFSVWQREVPHRQERALLGVYRYGTRLDGHITGDFLQFTPEVNKGAAQQY